MTGLRAVCRPSCSIKHQCTSSRKPQTSSASASPNLTPWTSGRWTYRRSSSTKRPQNAQLPPQTSRRSIATNSRGLSPWTPPWMEHSWKCSVRGQPDSSESRQTAPCHSRLHRSQGARLMSPHCGAGPSKQPLPPADHNPAPLANTELKQNPNRTCTYLTTKAYDGPVGKTPVVQRRESAMSRKPLCVNGNMTTLAPGFETRKARMVATPQLRACTDVVYYKMDGTQRASLSRCLMPTD